MSASDSKWMRYFSRFISVATIIIVIMIFLGRREIMGTRYEVSEAESVNYSGNATEEDARKLGVALKELGFFTGNETSDVLLRRDPEKGTILSFIVNKWDPETQSAFQTVGSALSDKTLGHPLTVRLLDDKLNTRHEVKIQ